ncbi:PREDICTED: putative F-box protein At4g17200 [Camelina sativa]|uniref:F-box protein At4g17200 n=1 Tax=Camelina sativa TaxID=90675 RepID=A0ABM0T140_CAMSA|nr:PREDICTED: putative F-box protein At4g17200 [Camelina sativa]
MDIHPLYLVFWNKNSRVCSMRFDLQGIRDNLVEPSIKQIGQLDQIEVSKLFHCDGLLLCVVKDNNSRLLVWNPYLGQTIWIQPRNTFHRLDRYALGYDNNRNHKVLRFLDNHLGAGKHVFGYEIYDFTSSSWRVLDVTPDWDIQFYQRGVSLKGNTYFFAIEKITEDGEYGEFEDFLLCFDFSTERFGLRLPLPFHSYVLETVTLSSVTDEQLAVLYQRLDSCEMLEIWVTTKIEPSAVSWTIFLKVDMRPLTGFQFDIEAGSFFIDQETKLAVVFDIDKYKQTVTRRYHTTYIIGQDEYFDSLRLGEAPNLGKPDIYCLPLVCPSYAPNLVQLSP